MLSGKVFRCVTFWIGPSHFLAPGGSAFVVSTIDVPDPWSSFALGKLSGPIEVKGIAYGGDRGISRVELSSDGGKSWRDAEIYYSGGNLAWSLWKAEWMPDAAGDYMLVARAT